MQNICRSFKNVHEKEMKFDTHIVDFIGDAFFKLLEQVLDDVMIDDVLKRLNMDHAFTKITIS